MSLTNCPHCGEDLGPSPNTGVPLVFVVLIALGSAVVAMALVAVAFLLVRVAPSPGGGTGPRSPFGGPIRSRIGTNESAAIGTLRSLATAQAQFQNQAIVDQDSDGMGEFGWLGELAGNADCRVSGIRQNTSPFIAAILGVRDSQGMAQKSGYIFRMYLPGAQTALTEGNSQTGEQANPSAADAQEMRWGCYAWPNARGQSGNRAFFVNHAGEVYATPNTAPGQQYSGAATQPAAAAALDTGGRNPRNLEAGIGLAAAGLTAGDGGVWVPAGN